MTTKWLQATARLSLSSCCYRHPSSASITNSIRMTRQLQRGLRNNNPLNIRKGNAWLNERHPQTDPAFEEFQTLEDGWRAGFIIIRNYIKKRPPINTPRKIISRWAPISENPTNKYLEYVCSRAQLKPDEPLKWTDKNKLCCLVWAMSEFECGCEFSFGRIENAYAMANRETP